jgi:hypothetical protein
MFEPHQRAALIPIDPGVNWPQFLNAPFVQPRGSFAIVVQSSVQKSLEHSDLKGLIEISSAASLPVIFPFDAVLNLEAREISIQGSTSTEILGRSNLSKWAGDGASGGWPIEAYPPGSRRDAGATYLVRSFCRFSNILAAL